MQGERTIVTHRKARRDYHILERYEAGVALKGTEVKSLRMGRGNLNDAYACVEGEEVFLLQCHISPYEWGNRFNHEPRRKRKLLLHRRQIRRLIGLTQQKGYTLIPLRLYFLRGKVKVELGVCKGKRLYDKREDIKRREADREMERAYKRR